MEFCATFQRYATPDHRWPSAESLMWDSCSRLLLITWTCSHLWGKQGEGSGPANYGVVRWPPNELHFAVLWPEIPLNDVILSCHPQGTGCYYVMHWHCSSCPHIVPAAGPMPFLSWAISCYLLCTPEVCLKSTDLVSAHMNVPCWRSWFTCTTSNKGSSKKEN